MAGADAAVDPDPDTTSTTPVVVLMAASSPWSRVVAEYLSESGLPVHVLDFNDPSGPGWNREQHARAIDALRPKIASLRAVPLPRPFPLRVLVGAWRLRRAAAGCDARAVLALYGGVQAAIACLGGLPYGVFLVGSDVMQGDPLRRLILRVSLNRAAAVLANGRHLAEQTRALAPRARVQQLYLGVDLERFRPPPLRNRAPRFVCSRAFSAILDNATIVRAVAALPSVPADFEMAFLSSGPLLDETVALADRVLAPAARRGVSFGRGVSDSQLVAALRSATFYVSASLSDGASSSLLEAMACGLFPIVSDIPASREWITHGENGLLFSPGDPGALARCLTAAMEGVPWMESAVETNLRIVAERADADVNMRQLCRLLSRLAQNAPAATAL